MNRAIENATSSMLFFFLKMCQGDRIPHEPYEAEIEAWLIELEQVLLVEPNSEFTNLFKELLDNEMEGGCYWEDPVFIAKMDDVLGDLELPTFHQLVEESYFRCVVGNLPDNTDGE